MAGEFRGDIERVEPIVLVGEVEQTQLNLDTPLEKAVAGEKVELPEIVARKVLHVTAIVLRIPERAELGIETRGMIVKRIKVHLVQYCLQTAARAKIERRRNTIGNGGQIILQDRFAQAIARAEGPFVAHQ